MRTITSAALIAALSGSVLAAAGVGPARADGSFEVGLTGFADIVVDEAGGHVFISQGSDTVAVTDLEGVAQAPLTGLDSADGMALSEDGATLWVSLTAGHGIAAVDTANLTVTTFPTGDTSCPRTVAETLGLVWFNDPCNGGGSLGALDPATGTVTAGLAGTGYLELATSPQSPGLLMTLTSSGGTLTSYAATATDPPSLTETLSTAVGGNGRGLAFTPDGSQVIVAAASPYEHSVFNVSDLSAAGTYPTGNWPNAVAVRADGMVAAGVQNPYDPNLYVFSAGSTTPLRAYSFPAPGTNLRNNGLAFGATRLYAVTSDYVSPGNLRLRVITPRAAASLTVKTDKRTYDFNQSATVTVRLSAAASSQRQVTVYAQENGGGTRLVGTGTIPVGGVLTLSRKVTIATKFVAEYVGDADTDAATGNAAQVKVHAKIVPKAVGFAKKVGKYYQWSFRKTAYVYGNVKPNHAGDCEYFEGQWLVKGRWGHGGTTGCVTLSNTSWAGVYLKGEKRLIPFPFRFRGVFKSAHGNLGAKSSWVYGRFVKSGAARPAPRPVGPRAALVEGDALR